MSRLAFVLILVLSSTAGAYAADPSDVASRSSTQVPSTADFLAEASATNQFELESSMVGLARAGDKKVRDFANRMIAAHMVVGAELKEAAAEAGLSVPPEELDVRRRTVVDDLKAKTTATFDRAYLETQYIAHVQAVALFQAYAGGGTNARMRQFARDKLPILQSHLEHLSRLR